jgi:oligogalacturonide transporter
MKKVESEKLPLKTKLFYASGDIFGGGAFNIINFFYAIFLTDVIGLKMQYIAPILLIGKIWPLQIL